MLGNVMKESVRCRADLCAQPGFGKGSTLTIRLPYHSPRAPVPKDGPSAGITITTALVSLLSGLPVKKKLAMTGEVTITGRVLPGGGIKEKFLAAYREGVKTILFPHTNEKDVSELPEKVRKS